ncbi:hypothetical protein ACFQPA_12875 [Halomarina halobia]|uniref:DUF8142 domain-containing protein n=1 Tax=Halomarina halobia TaxID=3033386 RepID=A0ABD6AAH0_9EURY|nr:hypothetical protein [Halomarina sp. PSR21]
MRYGEDSLTRKRAAIAILPFLLLGLANVALLLTWGLEPLWAFMILPPILFISVLGWFAFRGGMVGPGAEEEEDVERI